MIHMAWNGDWSSHMVTEFSTLILWLRVFEQSQICEYCCSFETIVYSVIGCKLQLDAVASKLNSAVLYSVVAKIAYQYLMIVVELTLLYTIVLYTILFPQFLAITVHQCYSVMLACDYCDCTSCSFACLLCLLVKEHQDEFARLIDDVKRRRGKNASSTKENKIIGTRESEYKFSHGLGHCHAFLFAVFPSLIWEANLME